MSCGSLNVEPPSLENANMIGPWTYRPLCGLKMNRVQLTYTRSRNGLPACVSTPIHSLSFRIEGAVVCPINVGGPQVRTPLPSNVPLLTAIVFGAAVRSNPNPAKSTWPWLSKANEGSPPASYCPPASRSTPGIRVPRFDGSLDVQHHVAPPSLE